MGTVTLLRFGNDFDTAGRGNALLSVAGGGFGQPGVSRLDEQLERLLVRQSQHHLAPGGPAQHGQLLLIEGVGDGHHDSSGLVDAHRQRCQPAGHLRVEAPHRRRIGLISGFGIEAEEIQAELSGHHGENVLTPHPPLVDQQARQRSARLLGSLKLVLQVVLGEETVIDQELAELPCDLAHLRSFPMFTRRLPVGLLPTSSIRGVPSPTRLRAGFSCLARRPLP